MSTSREEKNQPTLGASIEVTTKPPIICDTCEVIQHPEFEDKTHQGPDVVSLHMLEEAARQGCHFCRIILIGVKFFQNVSDEEDPNKPGLVLHAIYAAPQQAYSSYGGFSIVLYHGATMLSLGLMTTGILGLI